MYLRAAFSFLREQVVETLSPHGDLSRFGTELVPMQKHKCVLTTHFTFLFFQGLNKQDTLCK